MIVSFLCLSITVNNAKMECFINGESITIGNGKNAAISQEINTPINIEKPITISFIRYNILAIAQLAFACCDITAISFPKTLEQIGFQAFSCCSNLEIIDLSNTKVTIIPKSMASDCPRLIKIVFPDCLELIESNAFSCTALTSVDLVNVNSIDITSFMNCSKLTFFTASQKSPFLFSDSNLFADNGGTLILSLSKVQVYTVPSTVHCIGRYAFYNSTIEEINIPDSVKEICEFSFARTHGLNTVNINGSNLVTIGRNAFEQSSVNFISIPSSVMIMHQSTFALSEIKSIDLQDTRIMSIGKKCFFSCSQLTTVKLPPNIISIGAEAFAGAKISELYFPSSLEVLKTDVFSSNLFQTIDLHSTNVKRLPVHGFKKCEALSVLILPAKLTELENSCFEDDVNIALVIYCGRTKIIGHKFYSTPQVYVTTFYPINYFADSKVLKHNHCPRPASKSSSTNENYRNDSDYKDNLESDPEKLFTIESSNVQSEQVLRKIKKKMIDEGKIIVFDKNEKVPFMTFLGGAIMAIVFFYSLQYL